MKDIKISIIIPVYQTKKYIRKCIDSILQQTYCNIELLLIDDGSNDGSEIICAELSAKYSFIKTIHQANKGVGAARNRGIQEAIGDYILFVDSDDFIVPSTLEQLIKVVKQTNADIIFFDFVKLYEKLEIEVTTNIKEGLYNDKEEFVNVFVEMIKKNIANNIGTKLYKTQLIKNNNIYFNEKYNICEDILFCLDVTRKCKKIYYLKEKLYFYNINISGSLMSSYKKNLFNAEKELFIVLRDFMEENNQFVKQEKNYYDLYMNMIITVLTNEIVYNNNLKNIITEILNDDNVFKAKKHLQNLNYRKYILYYLIWKRKPVFIYYLSKLYLWIQKLKNILTKGR